MGRQAERAERHEFRREVKRASAADVGDALAGQQSGLQQRIEQCRSADFGVGAEVGEDRFQLASTPAHGELGLAGRRFLEVREKTPRAGHDLLRQVADAACG